MKKEIKIEYSMKQEEKYRIKLKDLCEKYAEHKITFGIVFAFIKKYKIVRERT